jgi:hypothetical protein
MGRFWSDLNPTIRGFLLIGLVALVVVVLSLEQTIVSLHLIARVAFFLAIAFVLFMLWRDRREDIASWSRRGQAVFYGAAALSLLALGVFFWPGTSVGGLDAVAFISVLAICIFSMVRVWRHERTYAY